MSRAPANQRPWRLSGHWWLLPVEEGEAALRQTEPSPDLKQYLQQYCCFSIAIRAALTTGVIRQGNKGECSRQKWLICDRAG